MTISVCIYVDLLVFFVLNHALVTAYNHTAQTCDGLEGKWWILSAYNEISHAHMYHHITKVKQWDTYPQLLTGLYNYITEIVFVQTEIFVWPYTMNFFVKDKCLGLDFYTFLGGCYNLARLLLLLIIGATTRHDISWHCMNEQLFSHNSTHSNMIWKRKKDYVMRLGLCLEIVEVNT